jgi:hypothetical protein
MPAQAQDFRVSSSPSIVCAFGFRPKRSRRICLQRLSPRIESIIHRKVIFSATACEQKNALVRAIWRLAQKIPRDRDSVAERGGFEPPRPFRVYTRSRRAP